MRSYVSRGRCSCWDDFTLEVAGVIRDDAPHPAMKSTTQITASMIAAPVMNPRVHGRRPAYAHSSR